MSGPAGPALVVTAEHGGNEVPAEYRGLFRNHRSLLHSHRGWDPGTLHLARWLAAELGAPLVASRVTRLLVELNRSPHNPRVLSAITRPLPREERRSLLERWHRPHWDSVGGLVAAGARERGRVLHLAVHSFTPVLDGAVRKPDLALLYDPARTPERDLAVRWVCALAALEPARAVRRNDPYRGTADGLTTSLRKRYGPGAYLGIEIEVNQKHVGSRGRFPAWVGRSLLEGLVRALAVGP